MKEQIDGQMDISDFISPPKWDIANVIPVGKANAINRVALMIITGKKDRTNRSDMAESEYVIVNTQDGKGYFIPTAEDVPQVRKKLKQEVNRMNSIQKRIRKLEAFLLRHQGEC